MVDLRPILCASMKTFTGSAPFDLHLSITVSLAIMRGDRPPRPPHPDCTQKLWELMQRCWSQEISSRPNMPNVLQVLESVSAPLYFQKCGVRSLIDLLCAVSPLNLAPTPGHFPNPRSPVPIKGQTLHLRSRATAVTRGPRGDTAEVQGGAYP